MPQRLSISLLDIAQRGNLALATYKAAQGKRQRPSVARWLENIDSQLSHLAQRILVGAAPSGRALRFVIHDPKRREISAACFEDRVLHHAIFNLAQPWLDRSLSPAVYACRTGYGVHSAVLQVQRGLQRWPWVVQVDIAGYFANIDHGVLKAQLARRFKGPQFLELLSRIIDTGVSPVQPGAPSKDLSKVLPKDLPKGLPIGALASQHFANSYLGCADRLLEAWPGVHQPVRYMDDMVWFCASREVAQASLAALRQLLHSALRLELKPGVVLRSAVQGLQFCGFQVRPGALWPGPRKRARYRQAAARLQALEAAAWPHRELQVAYAASHSALLPADSLGMRRATWAPPEVSAPYPGAQPL